MACGFEKARAEDWADAKMREDGAGNPQLWDTICTEFCIWCRRLVLVDPMLRRKLVAAGRRFRRFDDETWQALADSTIEELWSYSGHPEAPFHGIIRATHRNLCIDEHGCKRRKLGVSLDASVWSPAAGGPTPAERAGYVDLHAQLERLAPNQAVVLHLHYFKQLEIDEIARVLGIPGKTVHRWHKQGKDDLGRLL